MDYLRPARRASRQVSRNSRRFSRCRVSVSLVCARGRRRARAPFLARPLLRHGLAPGGVPRRLRLALDPDVVRRLRVRRSRPSLLRARPRLHPRLGLRRAPPDIRQLPQRQVRGHIPRVHRHVAHRRRPQPPRVRGEPHPPHAAVHRPRVHRHHRRPHRAARPLQLGPLQRASPTSTPQKHPRRRSRRPRGAPPHRPSRIWWGGPHRILVVRRGRRRDDDEDQTRELHAERRVRRVRGGGVRPGRTRHRKRTRRRR